LELLLPLLRHWRRRHASWPRHHASTVELEARGASRGEWSSMRERHLATRSGSRGRLACRRQCRRRGRRSSKNFGPKNVATFLENVD
jgi:hypothetical protein